MFTSSSIIVSIRNAAITIWITLTTFLKTLTSSQTPFQYSRKEIDLPETMSVARTIVKAFKAIEKAEGAGARVRRSVGTHQLQHFSPFLMLDHFTIGEGAGFPDHPHRFVPPARPLLHSQTSLTKTSGQETITYLLEGSVDHEDFAGNAGTIHAGDLQFMTAGRGIIHAEMPGKSVDGKPNVGLQLWVDLPKHLKFCEPRYRDLRASEVPVAKTDGDKVEIKVISGNSHGVDSVRDLAYTPVWILDVTMKPGAKLAQPLPKGWNAFVYTLKGSASFVGKRVEAFHNVVFAQEGDGIDVAVDEAEKEDARFGMFFCSFVSSGSWLDC